MVINATTSAPAIRIHCVLVVFTFPASFIDALARFLGEIAYVEASLHWRFTYNNIK